jgi:hypothetical protein
MAWDDPIVDLEECCEELRLSMRRGRFILDEDHREIHIKYFSMYQPIKYCPFCGQKFNITSKAIYT